MSNTQAVNDAKAHIEQIITATEADSTIPPAHKSILNKILSFLLRILPSISEIFAGSAPDTIDISAAEPLPSANDAATGAHPTLSPVGQSLSKAVQSVASKPGANHSILSKIFSFVLKILPTVLGIFSHAPASTATAGGAAVSGATTGPQTGGDNIGGSPASSGITNPTPDAGQPNATEGAGGVAGQ